MLAEITAFPISPWTVHFPERMLSLTIGVAILLFLLYKVNIPIFSWPYISGVMKERAARIEENHNQVERALTDIRQLHDDYSARLKTIEEEARQRIDAAVREAEAVRTEIIAEAQMSATALQRRSEEEIDRERTRQRILLRRQIVQIALDAAEQSVITQSDDRAHRQLIQEFITRAGSESSAASAPTQEA